MSTIQRWWARAAAVGAGIGLALVVPALAWAAETPAMLAVAEEVGRRGPRRAGGLLGGLGTLCCIVVVVIIVLVVVLMMRRRQRR
jgi:hypothetical protein